MRGKDKISRQVATLGAGDSFGQLALINDSVRMATITTMETSTFLVVSRSDYQKCIQRHHIRLVKDSVQFLRGLDTFSGWEEDELCKCVGFVSKIKVRPTSHNPLLM